MTRLDMKILKMNTHDCDLDYDSDDEVFPPPPPKSSSWLKAKRVLRRSMLICKANPRCGRFLRTSKEINQLRKKQYLAGKWTIHPFSMFRLYYEMYMAVVYFICHCYFPFSVAYIRDGDGGHQMFVFFNLFFNVFYAMDLVVTLFTGYWDRRLREVVMSRMSILKRTLCSIRFYLDVISCIPTTPALYGTSNLKIAEFLHLLTLFKLNRLTTNFLYVHRSGKYLGIKGDIFDICILGAWVLLILHFATCLEFIVPKLRNLFTDSLAENQWVYLSHVWNESLATKYFASMYRAFANIFTIRIGAFDKSPWGEIMTAIIMYSFGKVFVLSISVVVSRLVMSSNALELKYYRIMSQVEYFMDKKDLPTGLRNRIVDNYFYKYHGAFCKESKIFELLSDKLRREVTSEVLGKLSMTVNLFKELSQQVLQDVLANLKAEIYMPNDIIIKSGASGECMYFLASGTVCIITPSGKEVCHLQDGDYFGEVSLLFKGKSRTADVVALEICEVYKLAKKSFYSCFGKNPDIMKMLRSAATFRIETTEIYEDIHVRTQQAGRT